MSDDKTDPEVPDAVRSRHEKPQGPRPPAPTRPGFSWLPSQRNFGDRFATSVGHNLVGDEDDIDEQESPAITESLDAGSSFLGFIFMTYLDKLFTIGNRRTLELKDLGPPRKDSCSAYLHSEFMIHYGKEIKKPIEKRSLWHVMWQTVGYPNLFLGLSLFGMSAAIQFGPVQILTRLVRYFQGLDHYTTFQLWLMVKRL
jgi:hypothetical protein